MFSRKSKKRKEQVGQSDIPGGGQGAMPSFFNSPIPQQVDPMNHIELANVPEKDWPENKFGEQKNFGIKLDKK
jgi:hypothetical protein